jgi:cytochrome c peroxidase
MVSRVDLKQRQKEEGNANRTTRRTSILVPILLVGLVGASAVYSQETAKTRLSYAPVVITEDFTTTMARMKAAKVEVMKRQMDLLNARYDLSNRPAADGAKMSRGKPVQEGIRVKLPPGVTWSQLAAMSLEEISDKGLFPKGFPPLPHPNHGEGGMVFPTFHIEEIKKQEERDAISRASTSISTCQTISSRSSLPPCFSSHGPTWETCRRGNW